jgi:preprotein translocase SecE subunit
MKAIAFAIGAGTFALIMLNKNTNSYLHEVMSELNKVSWPTWDETFKGTIIVVIFVVVAGAILGLFDYIWTAVLKWVV